MCTYACGIEANLLMSCYPRNEALGEYICCDNFEILYPLGDVKFASLIARDKNLSSNDSNSSEKVVKIAFIFDKKISFRDSRKIHFRLHNLPTAI